MSACVFIVCCKVDRAPVDSTVTSRVQADTPASDPCPLHLAVGASPDAWGVPQGDSSARLVGVTFYDGAPKEGASLVPDSTTAVGNSDTAVWLLSASHGRESWLSCRYEGTNVVLSRPLASTIHRAEATYDSRAQIDGLPAILGLVLKP